MRKGFNMVATTDQKARFLDLITGVLELVRDGNRNIDEVMDVFQTIKDERDFAAILGRSSQASTPAEQLLSSLGTVVMVSVMEQFVAREKFVVGGSSVEISWLGDHFRHWFLGKSEDPVPRTKLRYSKLTRFATTGSILTELGDEAETALAQIWALMERQANGEEGILLTNGQLNVFYVRDIDGELRAVFVNWVRAGWGVSIDLVTGLDWCGIGSRVFSRSS